MDFIEAFLSRYPSIISALSAVATASAVIVALYLARRQTKSRLQVFADVSIYMLIRGPVRVRDYRYGGLP